MRVLNINKFYYLRGGVERYYFSLEQLLAGHGHEVIPFSMQDQRNRPTPFAKYFVSNLDLARPGLKMLNQAGRPIWSREARRQLEALLDAYKPDIAHVHMLYHHLSPSILPLLKERGIPVVMTLHDYKLICPNYLLFTENEVCRRCKGHKYYNAVIHKCLKDSYAVSAYTAVEMSLHKLMQVYEKNIDLMIAPSVFVRDTFVEFGQDKNKIVVIPHFIDPLFLDKAKGIEAVREKPYMLYLGRLAKEKGVDQLLEMLYIHRPHLRLKIAGTGPLEQSLKDFVASRGLQSRVDFLGHITPEQLIGYSKGAACVVMPSRFLEPFGFAALETMALGTPLVATATGALTELVPPNLGRLFKRDDLAGMARAVEEVMSWDRAELRQAGAALMQERYLPQTHYDALMTVYGHLIK
ncbi:MAG: glycosyltransferase family 4 protein [Parcubacteria group bacterium]|nr:glycosyltransferase family 4 protein [Parcubacteria group bacterium]